MTELTKIYDRIVPHLAVKGGREAIEFYHAAFGADVVRCILAEDETTVLHAELSIVGSRLMLHDEFPEHHGTRSPLTVGGASVTIDIALDDPHGVDKLAKMAQHAGATVTTQPTDMPWGDRYARLTDPFGHMWAISAPLIRGKSDRGWHSK